MTHRLNAIEELKKSFPDFAKDRDCLEVGAGNQKDFREYFKNSKSWFCTDKSTGIYMEEMGYIDEVFDVVFGCHCFEHCEQPVKALKEFNRVLKPGGELLLVTPYPNYHQVLGSDNDHIFVLNEMQMIRLLKYTGFKDIKVFISQVSNRENDWNVFSYGVKK